MAEGVYNPPPPQAIQACVVVPCRSLISPRITLPPCDRPVTTAKLPPSFLAVFQISTPPRRTTPMQANSFHLPSDEKEVLLRLRKSQAGWTMEEQDWWVAELVPWREGGGREKDEHIPAFMNKCTLSFSLCMIIYKARITSAHLFSSSPHQAERPLRAQPRQIRCRQQYAVYPYTIDDDLRLTPTSSNSHFSNATAQRCI